jgi:hypothetical protein
MKMRIFRQGQGKSKFSPQAYIEYSQGLKFLFDVEIGGKNHFRSGTKYFHKAQAIALRSINLKYKKVLHKSYRTFFKVFFSTH